MDHIGLRREQLPLEAGDDDVPMCPRLAGVDRRVGAVERVEQLVAELGHEVLQAERKRGVRRIEQVALRGDIGKAFKIEGHGDAPMNTGHAPPRGR
ncbi:hypothetical protein D9M70_534420 [compost metagenome]